MPRSHPPTPTTLASATLRSLDLRGAAILVAVSGGPDSMGLLHVLSLLRPKLRLTLVAHGVDHGLRAEAAKELDLAEAFAGTLGIAFSRTVVSVDRGGNLQARARTARYAALREACAKAGAAVIATAHHATDKAETVLLRLLRGAGPAGLAVLPPRAGDLLRPLIQVSKPALLAHVERHRIPYVIDPSNRDPKFLRTRVRHELLPLLTELSPTIEGHLCALAEQLADRTPDGLSRAVHQALSQMIKQRSGSARVLLPEGLVAKYDRTQHRMLVTQRLRPRAGEPHRT